MALPKYGSWKHRYPQPVFGFRNESNTSETFYRCNQTALTNYMLFQLCLINYAISFLLVIPTIQQAKDCAHTKPRSYARTQICMLPSGMDT